MNGVALCGAVLVCTDLRTFDDVTQRAQTFFLGTVVTLARVRPLGESMNTSPPLRGSRARLLPQALSSLCVLALLFLGLPIFGFRQLGSPFTWRLPRPQAFSDVLSGHGVSDSAVLGACAVVALTVWALAIASLVVEGMGAVRGRSVRNLRVSGPMQRWIVSLIASAATLFSSVAPSAAASTRPSLSAMATAVANATVAHDSHGEIGTEAQANANPVHVVAAGESLWLIAEQYLGSGFEWERLADFNDGRSQPGGVQFSAAAAHLTPGWTLEIPLEPKGGASHSSMDSDNEVVVQPGDTLWGIADEELNDGRRWPEIFELNRGIEQADHQQLVNPNLIQPGWRFQVPGADTPPGAVPTPAPAGGLNEVPAPATGDSSTEVSPAPPAPVDAPAPSEGVAAPAGAATSAASDASEDAPAVFDFRWGVLGGAAALALVRLRRRRRDRFAASGDPLQLPTGEQLERVRELEHTSIPNGADYRNALERHLAHTGPSSADAVRWDGRTLSSSQAWSGTAEDCERGPNTPGTEWHWSTERSDSPGTAEAGGIVLRPSFVSVGWESDGVVALNCERLGVINLDGEPERVRALAANMMLELDGGGADPMNEVIAVGEGLAKLATSLGLAGRIRAFSTLCEVQPYLHATRHSVAQCLSSVQSESEAGTATTQAIRPVIVVCEGTDPDAMSATKDAMEHPERRGVGMIILHARGDSDQATVEVRGASTVVGHLGLILESLELEELVEKLLAVHEGEDECDCVDVTATTFPLELPGGVVVGVPESESPECGRLHVRVLGAPEVEGSHGPLSARHIECITYVALHGPVSSDRVRTALWPSRTVSESRWSSFLSEIRSALGVGPDGTLIFPHLRSAGVRLNAPFTTDLDEFSRAYAAVRDDDGPAIERASALAATLDMVGGQPFQSRGGYEWAFAEGTVAYAERVIGEASHLAVHLAVEAGELELASRAIERGLNALPGNELLFRDRMILAHARGDRSEIDRTFRELVELLEAEGIDATPHPRTVALRDELMSAEMQEV